jgi:hypothetical protein
MDTENEQVQYGIVELMGHKVVAGKISKSEMFGKPMLRVDIPGVGNIPPFTQFYGDTAIYCITFVSEEIASRVAADTQAIPVIPYSYKPPQLTNHVGEDDDDIDHDPFRDEDDDDPSF